MKASLLSPLLLIVTIMACERPTKAINDSNLFNEYNNPVIRHVWLKDTLPSRFASSLQIQEIQGVKAEYPSGKFTSYFEYKPANAAKLLMLISALPFKKTNAVNDTNCRANKMPFSLSGKTILSSFEIDAASFFWQINPRDYDYYECIKTPARHTILIHKKTGKVLHRIETVS